MKLTLAFYLLTLAFSLNSQGQVVINLPDIPADAICKPQGREMATFGDNAASLAVSDRDSDNLMRKQISLKVMTQFVGPAINTVCRKSSATGWEVLGAVIESCAEGCKASVNDWPVNGQAKSDLGEICRADCRAVVLVVTSRVTSLQQCRGKM